MIEILFILGFSIHNIEEALWLPEWSKYARKYHQEIAVNEFRFAVIVITAMGYLVTFQYLIFSKTSVVSKYLYLGFVSMMVLNTIFPHLVATIALRKYAPGLITGILLNFPIGIYLIIDKIHSGKELLLLLVATI
jgi:predicted neutral ceramidase superfamily lipid hydrolase